jgi:diacylglycerol kinase (ATP)
VWAREAFVPPDAQRALALLANGRRARVDVGEVTIGSGESRRFLLMCGSGVDAGVVAAVEARPRLKRALARMAFLAAAGPLVARLRAVPVSIAHDGVEVRRALLLAVAGNTRLYGGMARLTDGARMDDGLLDVVAFSDRSPGARLRALRYTALAASAARGGLSRRTTVGVDYVRTRELLITPERPLAVQADGESLGFAAPEAPLRLRSLPLALTVVIGRRRNPLLGEA